MPCLPIPADGHLSSYTSAHQTGERAHLPLPWKRGLTVITLPPPGHGAAKTCKSLLGNALTPHPKGPDSHATLETSQIRRSAGKAFTSLTSNHGHAQREKGACGNQPVTLQPCTSPVPPTPLHLQSSLSLAPARSLCPRQADPSHPGEAFLVLCPDVSGCFSLNRPQRLETNCLSSLSGHPSRDGDSSPVVCRAAPCSHLQFLLPLPEAPIIYWCLYGRAASKEGPGRCKTP